MGFQNMVNALLNEIDDIRELLLHVKDNDKLSTIEIDLAKDKLRQIYDVFRMLEKPLNDEQENPLLHEHQPGSSKPPFTPPSDEKKVINPAVQPKSAEEPPKEKEQFEVKRKKEQPVDQQKEGMAVTIGDKFKDMNGSLNDQMAKAKLSNDLASKYQSKPIKNIQSAIGLNEKFQLINELFKGDSDLYHKTIDILNNAPNFNQAYMYLSENFNWDMDDEHVKRILDLTRRKFISQGNE